MSTNERVSESHFTNAFLSASWSGLAVYDAVWRNGEVIDFECRLVNKKMHDYVGFGAVEGRTLLAVRPEWRNNGLLDQIITVAQSGITTEFDFTPSTVHNSPGYKIMAVKFGDGLIVAIEEKDELQTSEQALQEAHNKLKLWSEVNSFAEEIGNIATWTYSPTDHIANFSDNLYCLYGLDPRETKNKTGGFIDLVHPDDRQKAATVIEKIQQNELSYTEYRILRPNGEQRILSNRGRMFTQSDGKKIYIGVTADITELKQTEQELIRVKEELIFQANEQFNALLNSIDDGFAILDQFLDDQGQVDFRYIEINSSFTLVAGIANPIGQSLRALFPSNAEESIGHYLLVEKTGNSLRYETQNPETGRWYDVYVFKPGQFSNKRIAILFSDITKRRLNEYRQSYLMGLNDKIRSLQDASLIQKIAAEELGVKTAADFAFYSTVTEQEDQQWYYLSHLYNQVSDKFKTGFYPLDHFPEITAFHKEGKKNSVHNVAGNTRLTVDEKLRLTEMGIQAWLSVPLIKNNRLVAVLAVAQNTPRIWSDSDLLILEETAELTWAAVERASAERALREAEKKYLEKLKSEVRARTIELTESKAILQSVFDSSPHSIGVFKIIRHNKGQAKDLEAIMLNRATELMTHASNQEVVSRNLSKVFEKLKNHRAYKRILSVADTGIAVDFEENFPNEGNDRWFDFSVRKVNDLLVIHTQDVTAKRRNEETLLDIKLRQQKEILNAIIHTQEQERQRIGEALHDGVAQLLYAIQIKLQMIPPNQPPQPGLLREINDIITEAIKDSRRISFELVPAVLKDYGLEVALRSLFQRIVSDQLKLNFIIKGIMERLPSQLEYALYRIVQEMVNNIIKHAKANEATVEINQSLNRLMVRIRDNGKGFSEKKIDPMTSGIGLQSVRNRVKLLNGIMRVTSDAQGTRVTIRLPLESEV
jgi:PAS domain S-box-containing protein